MITAGEEKKQKKTGKRDSFSVNSLFLHLRKQESRGSKKEFIAETMQNEKKSRMCMRKSTHVKKILDGKKLGKKYYCENFSLGTKNLEFFSHFFVDVAIKASIEQASND